MKYGKAIKTIRAAKGVTQKDLAKALNVDNSYLSRIEKGDRTPSIDVLEKIAKKLDVPFYLLVLLSSEKKVLKNSDKKSVDKIGENLLNVLLENK
ncbi:hypothetical protein A2630_00635 [Candidatus Woesebacteria bacterium RIFCSPHIGHO2_01_FULL_44_10]|uniref:HTH cro/C1-type domain-containing protein n=1 Tax=Candidatus Woesebacteria bacterium RIFCSPLOWO2_01_FULL_44_14 TaxID=1802525 RepID=A0A1F8C1M9_9BACT|nr:MAG: hypothetical protein A2630_00635 [Candidatus Woesebacteria bacterium RIFCSPHIGHO2_01_FULL_44_10]OGM54370.1 MAG: hypothetical protein A3F62_01295 [Candidatus Woesebacteria bacterium RIFCSPHIGHO2_12_FULL_44_11]OGM70271.1 MAG: hypothetical protein A2975_04340 [Candidatus Woesebacteria bacterium RIFCSPLOWO2_01_FULL_44_14]